MPGPGLAFGLLRRREVVLPTWRGWLALLLLAALLVRAFLSWVQPFLAQQAPVGGQVLVVEGWIPDYALRQALAEFRARRYSLLVTTGGPLPEGMAFSYQGSYARLASATLRSFGLPADSIAEVPSPPVGKDRTYAEGLALAAWMRARGVRYEAIDLWSFSTHARRSRMLYALALGDGTRVGVFAPRDLEYDAKHWWRTSNGVRRVTDEWIAWLYATLIFRG
jgi:hypothetical protein